MDEIPGHQSENHVVAPLRPLIVALVGPTAVGKTQIAIELAERLDGEIISADSRLFYRGVDIGAAKPTPADRARVPHHLIDIADPDQPVSLATFQRMAHEAAAAIRSSGHLPMLVGGTGQYVRALTQGWRPPQVRPDPGLRAQLEALATARGRDWLHARLSSIDPEAAKSIDARNSRRTVRALEVILTSGHKFSDQRGRAVFPDPVVIIGLRRPRQELYSRIDARIEAMFDAGLVQEVRGLLAKGYSADLPAMSAIGYRECIQLINGTIDSGQAKAEIMRATRIFVRRQSNWFRETDPDIRWFEAGDAAVVAAIQSFIQKTMDG